MAQAQAGGNPAGTTASFAAPLAVRPQALASAVAVTLPAGGTNVMVSIGVTVNGVTPTEPTVGFPFSWCRKTIVKPGETLILPYILPAVAPGAVTTATLTVAQDDANAPAPTLGPSAVVFAASQGVAQAWKGV